RVRLNSCRDVFLDQPVANREVERLAQDRQVKIALSRPVGLLGVPSADVRSREFRKPLGAEFGNKRAFDHSVEILGRAWLRLRAPMSRERMAPSGRRRSSSAGL